MGFYWSIQTEPDINDALIWRQPSDHQSSSDAPHEINLAPEDMTLTPEEMQADEAEWTIESEFIVDERNWDIEDEPE